MPENGVGILRRWNLSPALEFSKDTIFTPKATLFRLLLRRWNLVGHLKQHFGVEIGVGMALRREGPPYDSYSVGAVPAQHVRLTL